MTDPSRFSRRPSCTVALRSPGPCDGSLVYGEKSMADKRAQADKPVVTIKKYANRRLYNTATSSYVTLDHLSSMVKDGADFVVYDANGRHYPSGFNLYHRRGRVEGPKPSVGQFPSPFDQFLPTAFRAWCPVIRAIHDLVRAQPGTDARIHVRRHEWFDALQKLREMGRTWRFLKTP